MSKRLHVPFSRAVCILALFLCLMPSLSFSASTKNGAMGEPDPNANPMLAQYIKEGIKVYYLGTRSGLDGWFLMKQGQVQLVYTTADKQSILIGLLYGTDGEAVTENAVKTLATTHPEIASAMQQALLEASQMSGSMTPMSNAAAGGNNFAKPTSPGEKLVQELQVATNVELGNAKAPVLYMIMDPNCPHCQATWQVMREQVFKNTLKMRLIPIGRNEEDERVAARLLSVQDPLNAWDKYVSGDKAQLAGDADPFMLGAVKANHALIDRWSIKETPYLVYRSKNGQIKILAGEPKKVEAVLNDIGS